jgi:hypothetical protein
MPEIKKTNDVIYTSQQEQAVKVIKKLIPAVIALSLSLYLLENYG